MEDVDTYFKAKQNTAQKYDVDGIKEIQQYEGKRKGEVIWGLTGSIRRQRR